VPAIWGSPPSRTSQRRPDGLLSGPLLLDHSIAGLRVQARHRHHDRAQAHIACCLRDALGTQVGLCVADLAQRVAQVGILTGWSSIMAIWKGVRRHSTPAKRRSCSRSSSAAPGPLQMKRRPESGHPGPALRNLRDLHPRLHQLAGHLCRDPVCWALAGRGQLEYSRSTATCTARFKGWGQAVTNIPMAVAISPVLEQSRPFRRGLSPPWPPSLPASTSLPPSLPRPSRQFPAKRSP